jgi:hypothetical protein
MFSQFLDNFLHMLSKRNAATPRQLRILSVPGFPVVLIYGNRTI